MKRACPYCGVSLSHAPGPSCSRASKHDRDLDVNAKTTHTPGPWRADHVGFGTVYGKGEQVVCLMKRAHSTEEHHQREADTRLIAAAPDMLEALRDERDAIRIWRKVVSNRDVLEGFAISESKILLAIAKAEGQ